MNKKLLFIPSFLFLFCIASLVAGFCLNSTAAFTISGGSLTFFVVLYAVGILDCKIGGSQITLEKRVDTLEHTNTELQTIVTALFKAFYLLSDAASRLGGPSEQRRKLALEYLQTINHLIAPDVQKQVDADIAKLAPKNTPE